MCASVRAPACLQHPCPWGACPTSDSKTFIGPIPSTQIMFQYTARRQPITLEHLAHTARQSVSDVAMT
eukprot:363662-Chlamydomonas_euryale.AAC.24